jgi:DNA-binding NarL/FixJ family response regulator
VRSVLVCLRTQLAATAVQECATRLGLSGAIDTVVSGADALAMLAESPADVVLVDTAVSRPDTVGFTRRLRERAPDATVVFFGPEDVAVARAAVAAGARGLIRGGPREDLVTSVAKAVMLLLRPVRPAVPAQRQEPEPAPEAAAAAGHAPGDAPGTATGPGHRAGVAATTGNPLTPVGPPASGPHDAATAVTGTRRSPLTEREMQVLRGMADGKSNAEIGRELYVSEDTVKTHARRLFRKLDARDRAHAVAAAFRAGLVR